MTFKAKKLFAALAASAMMLASCGKSNNPSEDSTNRRVMILYSAGFNSLHSDLQKNINELKTGWLPTKKNGQDVVLVVSKPMNGSYSAQTSPLLLRLYKSGNTVVTDTIKVYSNGRKLVDAESFKSILQDIKSLYPAEGYGMIFSSHATGWLPEGYYSNPDYYEDSYTKGKPSRRTLGQEVYVEHNVTRSAEMEVEEMAAAIPYKLDYLLIDACFAGCVEVAYAFKDKADVIGFSQAEVLTYGFDYTTMSEILLKEKAPEKVCKNFIERYAAMTGDWRSATISAVRTSKIDALAKICKELNQKYSAAISSLDWTTVQPYFGGEKYWFFDLEDIYLQAGITDEERTRLEAALDDCVIYKGTTGQYYSAVDAKSHKVNVFSGFSMFLKSVPGDYIHNFYKGLGWDRATAAN
ncbi:MAG: hypothetical protein IJ151_05600 [Bacteroidales bacterium]|nr:hypothetical protein [Bacteroidales bacterium]